MGAGVRGDERPVGDLRDVPEPALVEVREVDEDPELVAGLTSARPASVSPGPMSGEATGAANGTPCPKAFGRLHVMPSERSPRACRSGRLPSPASIASAPSMCMTALIGPVSSRSPGSRTTRSAPCVSSASSLSMVAVVVAFASACETEGSGGVSGPRSASSGKPSGCSVKIAKKPPANPPARARSRSRWPSSERSRERALLEQHVVVSVEDRERHRDTVTWCSTSPVRSAARWRCSASAGRS